MNKDSLKLSAGWWLAIIMAMLIAGLFILKALVKPVLVTQTTKTTREVALTCTTDMATQYHIHPYLKIFINGTETTIPANIGIQPSCMTSLHTHDDSGKLHVESPEKRDFTLADFFAVWQKPFSKNQILEYRADATHQIRETVNDTAVSSFENTVLRDGDKIVIYYEAKATN